MTAPANGSFPHGVREAARRLHARGFRPIPVGFRSKRPVGDRWNEPAGGFDPDQEFPESLPRNLGLLLGEPSGHLVDIDLDSDAARAAADALLPPTGMISGRKSASRSHRWYKVEAAPTGASEKFFDPTAANRGKDEGLLLELRSTGGQTVCPPSIYPAEPEKGHPADEPCVWHSDGDPAGVGIADLHAAVRELAAAALLARPLAGRCPA